MYDLGGATASDAGVVAIGYSLTTNEISMKTLLTITAVLEVGTAIVLFIAPAAAPLMLLGALPDPDAGVVVSRILAGALLSLGMACWLARGDVKSEAALALVAGTLIYNFATVSVLVHAWFALGMTGVLLWPAVIVHGVLGVCCVLAIALGRRLRKGLESTAK